jgi:hypothetical protein
MSNAAQEVHSLIDDLRANAELFRQKIRDYDDLLTLVPQIYHRLEALEADAPTPDSSPDLLLAQIAQRFSDLENRIDTLSDAAALDLFREDLSQLKARLALFGVSLTKLEHQIGAETRAYKDGQAKLATEVDQIHIRLNRVQADVEYQKTARRDRPRLFYPLAAGLVICLAIATVALVRTHQLELAFNAFPVATSAIVKDSSAIQTRPEPAPPVATDTDDTPPVPPLLPPNRAEDIIAARARYALTYLERQNMSRLAQKYIHPSLGIHFLPDGFNSQGIHLDADAAENIMTDAKAIPWGITNEQGRESRGPFRDFFDRYIYKQPFHEATRISYNELPATASLTAADIARKFPGAIFAAYTLDNQALILVFSELNRGYWYLVSVINAP